MLNLKQKSITLMVATGFLLLLLVYGLIIVRALEKLAGNKDFDSFVTVTDVLPSNLKLVDRAEADKVLHELMGYKEQNLEDLNERKILNTVHYVWCQNETFSFRNYVSIMSVWKNLRPDIIEFHQQVVPKEDKYDDWLIHIKKTIPSFVVKDLPPHWDGDDEGCGFWFGLAVLDDRGGIFVDVDILVTDSMAQFLKDQRTFFLTSQISTENRKVAVAMGIDHDEEFKSFGRQLTKNMKLSNNTNFCEPSDSNITGVPCYTMVNSFNPYDIFTADTKFSEQVRKIVYGTIEKKVTAQILPGYIPKIVHYVWFGNMEMNFRMYLSMLSTLFILNPNKVILHTDGGLYGKYFKKIRKDKRVVILKRERPMNIFGHAVLYIEHASDIIRAECLLKYGGIYVDWDVLWLKDPDGLMKTGYDAIANFDHQELGNFPNTINLGVFMAKPKSTFVKRWQDALINYKSHDFLYNAVELPYKIYERFPQYLHIEKSLQVMCYRLKCHPTFHPDFKRINEEQPFDWRKDVYSIHFTSPDPMELSDEKVCKSETSWFAEIGRFILQHDQKLL